MFCSLFLIKNYLISGTERFVFFFSAETKKKRVSFVCYDLTISSLDCLWAIRKQELPVQQIVSSK